jgi:lipopolysaccharide/colanic/teichoic acid biosynthesis glycosyltransferase
VGLVALAPVTAVVAALVYGTMGRSVFFAQKRPGKGGRPFTLYKFRTMSDAKDAAGSLLPDAERLTRLGRFLRRSSLDEIPQLWNVLRGDMSLVGPRPLLEEYLPLYSPEQSRRHEVRPGITGWAQIKGRNVQSWEERLRLDVWYVDHRSLWLDVKILCTTLLKVLSSEGINQPGHATMPRFTGTRSGPRNG